MGLRDRVFADGEALGVIDAVVSAEKITGDAGYSSEGPDFGTEELERHQAAGYGGVGGSGEDCSEAHRG